jgi:two-component system OmpR family sensor kinase
VTLRLRLAVGLAFMAAVMAVGGYAVVRTIGDSQRRQLDLLLSDAVPGIAQVVRPTGAPITARALLGQLYVARLDPDGRRREVSAPESADGDAPRVPPGPAGAWVPPLDATTASSTSAATLPDIVDVASVGRSTTRWRAVVIADRTSGARLLVAASLAPVDATNSRLVRAVAAVAVAGLGAFGLVGWWVILLGLRPISDVAETARAIVSGDRTRRVELDDPRTEAGQLAQVFNLMVDENERVESRLRRFIADASHELRTPVASISGFSDLYRRGSLDDPDLLADAMRRIGGESTRMALLIDDLLLLARLDEGRPLALDRVDVAEVLRDAVLDAGASHPTRSIRLSDTGPVDLVGDEARLRQVVANLIQNALTHGGPDTSVSVGARLEGDRCIIEVADDGVGMTPEQVAHATDRFWRADSARVRRAGGTGLGLAITQAIVASHAGELRIESTPGAGTRVLVALPVDGVEAAAPATPGDVPGQASREDGTPGR